MPGGGTKTARFDLGPGPVTQTADLSGQLGFPVSIVLGDYDTDAVVQAIESEREWDRQAEAEQTTLFVAEQTDSTPAQTWGINSSAFLGARSLLAEQDTTVIERLLETRAGRVPRVYEQSEELRRLVELVGGEIIVEFYDGCPLSGDAKLAGQMLSHTITRETVETQWTLVFESSDAVNDQIAPDVSEGLDETGYQNVSVTEQDRIVTISGTGSPEATERIQSLL